MVGSPGCDLGTVTVLVTRPHRTGRRRLDNAVIESWHSTLEFELRQAVSARLAGYKVPKTVQVIDAIPLSPVGKVLRRALRELLWSGQNQ